MKRWLIASLGLNLLLLGSARAAKLDYLNLRDLEEALAEVSKEVGDDRPQSTFWRGSVEVEKDLDVATEAKAEDAADDRAASDAETKPEPDSEQTAVAQLWFQRFAVDQSLFSNADLLAMHQAISSMSLDDLRPWMEETAFVRFAMESGDWRETSTWLREFWRVQAFYSESEEAGFKHRMTELSPDELLVVMEHLTKNRRARLLGRQMADMRRSSLAHHAVRSVPRATPMPASVFPRSNILPRYGRRWIQQDRLSERIRNWFIFRGIFY